MCKRPTDRPTYERASPSQGLHYYSARYTGNITSYYVATPNFETKRRPFTTQYSVQQQGIVYTVQQLLQYIRSIVNTGLSDSGTLHTIAQHDTYSIHSYLHSGVCIIFENPNVQVLPFRVEVDQKYIVQFHAHGEKYMLYLGIRIIEIYTFYCEKLL